MRHTIVLFSLLFFFGRPLPAHAWNDAGHRVVALIAYGELTEAARKKADALLAKHPCYERDLVKMVPEKTDAALWAFLTASTWPDIIRDKFHPFHNEWHEKRLGWRWHFITHAFEKDGVKGPVTRYEGGEVDNVVKAVKKCCDELTSADTPDEEKAIYLAWLLHLVGDLHQPLHCTSLYSSKFTKEDGDRGGNLFMVRTVSGNTKLHAFWDNLLGSPQSPRLLDFHAGKIRKEHPRSALAEDLKQTATSQWVQDGFKVAVREAYLAGKLEGVSQAELDQNPALVVPALPADYTERARAIARRRIGLAGYRLADVLNGLLGE